MSVSKSALATLEDPVALGAIQASSGSFADTPERRAFENAREEAAVNAVNAASVFENALTRTLQPDASSVLNALDAQKMIEPSSRVRNGLRVARTLAYARDILKNPDRYQDGDAFAALNELSDGFAHDVEEWKRVRGMTDDPRQNLSTYVSMLDRCSVTSNLASAEPSSPYTAYYEATRSQETLDWDAIASAPLDIRFNHAIAKDPGGWRLTDVAKDWVHANLFDKDRITAEEEAAWVASEGGYDADTMRRYFANRNVRGKGAKEIVRDRERQLALEGASGVIVHSKPDDGRIPDQDYLVNSRQGKDGKIEYDRIDRLTDLTLDEYAETEKRRDEFVMKRRVVEDYQKRMEKKVAEDRAHAMLPFLNEYEAAAALSALRGEDMAKYRSFFENGFGDDIERRDMVWSVCASLRPRDAHGAWEDLIGRFGEGIDKAAFLSGKVASSLWNSYTRWPEILGTLAASGQEAAIAEKKMSDEELQEFSKELRFQLQYRQTMEAWIPNTDDNFAEQAVKGLADSGFLQGAAITASLAHIGGSTLLSSPHPAAKVGGVILHGVGYLTDAFGAASMIGDSFENMMMNGVDAERAAAVGLYAGCLNYLIEKGDVDMFLGRDVGLSPAELRKTGFRALIMAIVKKDPRLVMEALKADAKNAGRVAIAECAEEFGQALVDSGALKFAKGGEFSAPAFASAYLNQDTLKDGVDAFIDAIPTCTGFGLMANHSPLRGKNAQVIDAYANLADETAKRYALKHHIDAANVEDMANVRRLVLENAARHARTAANMDYEQRRAYFGQAAQEAGMSPSEAAFYEQAADLYRTLTAFEGQQYADAAMHGEINEAVLARAGIAVGHDENGYINSVTVDGQTRKVVTERGTREETDAHTGETGNVRGYYDPKDDSIHITVPETVSDVGETARTTTAPHELLHAALEAMANDPALTEEQRQTLDALLKTVTPSPNGTKLDANEAAAQFVERVFAVANRNFTPDREVVAIGNVVRNIGIALKKALGSKSEYLPAIIRKAGKGGISITDLLDPSFLADLDALQIAAEDKGTADPVVAWYANTMQPFFKALVDARSRTETTANLDAAEAQTASERGDTRGNSAAAGITFEDTTSSTGDVEPVADTETRSQPSQVSQPSQPTRPTINLPNGYSAEYELEEMPLSYVVMPGDPDYDANLADLNALQEAEPEDGVPVVVGGGNLLCGVNAIRRALDEGKTRITVRRIRRLRKDKQPSGQISAAQEAKRTGVRRFLAVHGNAYPALRYWLEHGRHIIDGSDPYIKAYLDNLSPADRMFLTGFGKGGTTADHLVEDFLNQYRSATETANERHYDGTMKPEDVLDQALRERDAYRQWKADGALSPDEQQARDEHDKFISEGHTEEEWNQHLEDLGNPLIGNETVAASDEEAAAIDAQIAEDLANGFFSLVREYDDIIGDQLAAMIDAPRFSLSGRTAEEQAVWDRWHGADGTPRKGWMKAPNGKPTRLTERQWLQVRTPAFKAWFGDWENAYYTRGWYDVREADEFVSMSSTDVGHIQPIADKAGMKEAFRSFGDVSNADDGRVVRFPMEMAGRTVFFKNYANAFKLLFEGSKRAWSEKETQFEGHKSHPNIEAYHHYLNKFRTPDGEYFVRFTVREGREGAVEGRDIVHAANVTDVEVYKNGTTQTDKLDRNEVPSLIQADKSARIDNKIAHFLNRVNVASVSKVVDDNGEPLVVYHGTNNQFSSFDVGKIGKFDNGTKIDWSGEDPVAVKDDMFFFTSSKDGAKFHADGAVEIDGGKARVVGVFIGAKKPLVKEVDKFHAERKYWDAQQWYDGNTAELQKEIGKTGSDALIVRNPVRKNDILVGTKNPNAIKSSDPVTYDDAGNVIQQSNRFNPDNPDIRYSIATYDNGGRKTLEDWMKKNVASGQLDRKDAEDILRSTDAIRAVMGKWAKSGKYATFGKWSQASVQMDENGNPYFGVIRTNGDYAFNIDFSTVCKKRRPLDAIFSELVRQGIVNENNVDQLLSRTNIPKIQEIIKEHGLEVACALCFVDAKRYNVGADAKTFSNMWNSLVDEKLTKPQKWAKRVKESEGQNTYAARCVRKIDADEAARVKVDASELLSGEFFDEFVRTKPEVAAMYRSFKGQAKAKESTLDVAYNNDIIRMFKHSLNPDVPSTIRPEDAYSVGGVRLQSFSDFVSRLIFDYVQMFAELAARHLPLHTYTKEVDFVRLFGKTGAKINMSLVPNGSGVLWLNEKERKAQGRIAIQDKDGKPVVKNGKTACFDFADECFPPEEAFRMRSSDGNVGTIIVGVSDEHIGLCLADPRIDMVIPYHKSSINPEVAKARGIDKFSDYTSVQHTKGAPKGKDFDFYGDLGYPGRKGTNDPRKTALNYIKWCKKNKYTPKFGKWAQNENYYKLLADFRLYRDDGSYVPQTAVRQVNPDKEWQASAKKALVHDNADARQLSSETSRIVNEIKSKVFGLGSSRTRFSLHVNPNLRDDVESALVKRVSPDDQSRQMKRHDAIVFSENFPFFEFLGLPNVRVVSDVVKIRKFFIKHHLTEDQIADLPNSYNNPVAVMKDGEGGFVALTDMKAKTDNGEDKPVRVYLRPREWRSGEVVFVATAMAENAADERKYYEPLAKSGLLFADENRIAGLGLEEETESILRTQASGDRVLTASDYSWWSTRNSIANPGANVNAQRFSVSSSTRRKFASDPQTVSWTVYAEPNAVRSMTSEHLIHEDPLTDKTDNTSVVKAMRVLFTSIGAIRNGNDGSYAVFNNSDAGKMLMQSGTDMRIFAPHMKRLFEGAVLSWSEPPLDINGHTPHPDVIGYKQYINKFTDADGIEKFVRFTVREHKGKDGRRGIHAATISEVSVYQEESAAATNPANKSGGSNRNFTDIKIAKFLSKGKGASSGNVPRFSLSIGIEGEGDPFAAKNNPVDFLLAHRIFANGGKVPSREETDRLLKRFGSKEQPRDVLARAVSLSQNIAGFLDRIGQDPDVVRAVAVAGLAVEAKGAQTRAQNALMTFDAKAAEAKSKIDEAYRRKVENASGIGYREMLSYYGLDMEQILLAMPPPSQNRAKAAQDAAGDAPKPDAYELTDADRAAVDAAVAAIVSRGEGLAAAANAEHPGQSEKATEHETTDTVDEEETDPEVLRAQAMNAAVMEAVRKSGITIDNPLAMVALVRRLTEDYIRRNPDTVSDFNEADPFASRVALAVFAANLSQFAQAVAQGYAPSYARVRIARLCERLDGRGLSTLRQVERVGEMIFSDLSRDVIRQSRAELMRNLHNGDAPKKGEAKDPNRWRGIDYYAKKHGVNLAEPDRVVSAFAGNYLRILKRVVELSQAKAAERAAKLQETVDAFKDTDDKAKYRDYQNALLELDILAAYGALRTKMPAEIADKSAAIKSFVMQDLDALNAKKEAFEQKRVELRDAMTAAIAGNPKDNGRMPDKHPGLLYSLVGMLEARASVLTSFCSDASKRQFALDAFSYVQRLLFHGYTQERAFLNDAKVAMRDAVKSVFGRFGQNTFAKLLDTKLDEATCKLLDRGGQKTKWRIGNVMQMYVSCLQADYVENCKAHGRDAAYVQTLKTVIEKADPRLLRMIDVMRTMYAEYGKEISKATLAASGVPIQTPNPLYMPVKPLLLMRAKNGEGRAFHPYAPALTPRVRHGYDFDQSADIMELWQDRIQQSAHTIGFLEAAPLIQGTMQSSHVLEAIHAAWGEQYANHWNDYVLTCLAGRKETSMPKVMANLSRAVSRLFLWFNVGSNINQLQAVFTSALSRDVGGIRGMAKHLSFWALKPVEMWQAARDLTSTRAFKARYGSDLNAAIAAAQREGKYGVLRSTVGSVADVGMKGIEIGDKVGVLALANVYRAERIALENAGMDPSEASEQAAEKLMLIAENTAQGTTDMNTFDEQSRLGALTSLFMQFKTAPLQQFGYEFAAFREWKAYPTDSRRSMKLLSTILVNHVLANIVPTAIDAIMTTVFGAIRGDDDKEKGKNRRHVVARALARAFLGPFGSVMFYGVIADNAVQFVSNWMTEGKPVRNAFGSSGSLPADNAVEMIANAVEGGASTLFKAVENGTIDDLVETSIDVMSELSTMTYPGRMYKKTRPKKKKSSSFIR